MRASVLIAGLMLAALSGFAQVTVNDVVLPTATRTGTYGPIQFTGTGNPTIWTVTAGSLPPNLSLSSSGVLSGTVTFSADQPSYAFTVTGQAGAGGPSGSRAFMINVVDPPTLSLSSLGSLGLPDATGNVPYDVALGGYFNINGGVPPYRFVVSAPLVGFSVNGAGTNLVGAPLASPGSNSIGISVQDSNGGQSNGVPIAITILGQPLAISTATLPNWTVGRPYSPAVQGAFGNGFYRYSLASGSVPPGTAVDAKLSCPTLITGTPLITGRFLTTSVDLIGGTGPRDIYVTSGTLPPGLSLSSSGVLSGVAGGTGTFNFRISARDPNGLGVFRDCSLTVAPFTETSGSTACVLGSAHVGSFYSSGLRVQNPSSGPASYSLLSGALPVGLTLDTATGLVSGVPQAPVGQSSFTISANYGVASLSQSCTIQTFANSLGINTSAVRGVPTTPGTYNFTLGVDSEQSQSASQAYAVVINPLPILTNATLPGGNIGIAYSSNAIAGAATSGTPPYTFAIANGALPPGLTLSGAGLVSGTPTAGGPFSFQVIQTDAAGAIASNVFSITVGNSSNALNITTASLPVGIVGVPYPSTNITASGGTGTGYSFTTSGPFVAGLTLAPNGAISGTPQVGTSNNITFVVSDSSSGFASRSLELLVTEFGCPVPFGIVGQFYEASAFTSPFSATSFAVSAGQLPPGIGMSSGGVFTGASTVEGTYSFTLTATDASLRQVSRSCTITTQSGLQLTSPRTTARVGVPYQSTVSALGGTIGYSYSVVNGALPTGLNLNGTTGLINGIPTTPGASNYRVRSQSSNGLAAERDFTIYVLSRDTQPELRCPLPSTIEGSFYNSGLSLNSLLTPTYSLTGNLPPGLALDPATGRISGTSFAEGTYNFTAQASLPGRAPVVASCQIGIVSAPPSALRVACPDQTDLVLGEPYASPAIASGGRRPYRYEVYLSSLPTGLSLNADTGLVSGTMTSFPPLITAAEIPAGGPNQATQSFFYTLRVVDARGFSAVTIPGCNNSVSDAPPITILTSSLPAATVGGSYTAPIQVSGGIPVYVASISSGSLPAGLQLVQNSSGISISGVPTQAGVASFRLRVQDSFGQIAFRDYVLVVTLVDPLRLTTNFLNGATVGVNFSQTIEAAGGTPPYRFGISGGATAPGTSLGPGGTLQGVPTTAGTYRFEVEVSDAAGGRTSGAFSLAVFQGNFRLGCPNSQAELGVPYSSAANVLGGSQPYAFSIAGGQLPNGLNLDSATGLISGRPTQGGVFVFTFGVSDARQARTQTQCSIGVQSGALRILTTGPITTRAGEPYEGALEAAGGAMPYRWSLLSSSPEAGLTVNADGRFTGRTTRKGRYPVVVQVTDVAGATASRSIEVDAGDSTLTLACPAVTRFQLGVQASGNFVLSGGLPPYQLSLTQGSLPNGFSFTPAGTFTVRALEAGTFAVQFLAGDATGTTVTTRCSFEVTGETLTITTDALPEGRVGTAYSAGLATRGAVGPVRFGLTSGGLPAGLTIDGSNGSISGTPEQEGSFSVGVSATDELQRRAAKALSLTVASGTLPFRITTGSPLSDGFVGRAYSGGFAAEGGKAPYTWSIEGLPAGLTASGDSFGGTPTAAGEATVAVSVRDAAGLTASKSFLLRIKADGLTITTESLPDGVVGQVYGTGLTREGGRAPFTWSIVSGSIPPGVVFNPATGEFDGSPTTSGVFAFSVIVVDALGASAQRNYSFEVRPAGVERLSVTTASLANGNAGVPYTAALGATGGRTPYSWSLNGDLPAGLAFASNGTISGTPTTVGTASFVVTVTDALGLRASRALSLRIGTDSTPALTIEGLPDTANANQTLPFTLRMASAFGVPVTGRLTLVFVPDTIHNADDPAIRFAGGTRTVDFTIPVGSTTVNLTGASISTGTLAGTIRIESVLNFAGTSAPGPTRSVALRRAVPVITNLRLTRTAGGLEVRVEGYTNTRQLSEARVTFTASGNVDLTSGSQVTVNVAAAIQAWFASSAAAQFGGQFALTLPFTVSGDAAGITGVNATIVNGEGSSASATAN